MPDSFPGGGGARRYCAGGFRAPLAASTLLSSSCAARRFRSDENGIEVMLTQTQITESEMAPLRSLTRHALSETIRSGLMVKVTGVWRDRRGSTAILFALAMPMLIGALGIGFEVSNWYMVQRGMQNAADAAVLAAASNGGANYDVEGKAVAAQFGFTNGVNNVGLTVLQNVACPGGGDTCCSPTITTSAPLYLSPAMGYPGSGVGQK